MAFTKNELVFWFDLIAYCQVAVMTAVFDRRFRRFHPAMPLSASTLLALACLCLQPWALPAVAQTVNRPWQALPPLPDKEGFAAPFAGVLEGRLIVAGGANFPDKRPWEGGVKVWYDAIWSLDGPEGEWRQVGRLPYPLAYGVSLTVPEGMLCLGGSDATRHHATCFWLRLDEQGHPQTEPLPPLPRACANFCGVVMGRQVWVAGGLEKPEATEALNTLWSLDLERLDRGWQEHAPWPGRGRMLAMAGAHQGWFYLVGGAALKPGPDGKAERVWLRETWRYSPSQGWEALSDLPQAAVAAPTPLPLENDRLLLLGGDDGSQVHASPEAHQGFSKDILAYDVATNTWSSSGQLPLGLVTTPSVIWQGRIVLPGGEKKPGFRSTEVWARPLAKP